jgi:HrpA-like RNA helicase
MSKKSTTKINTKSLGIYDIEGININPLTEQPYKNLYSKLNKTINGESLPATYANLAKIWSSKLVYSKRDEIQASILENQITLAKAGTGVGKTVLIPKIALHAFGYKEKVITTIPKKIITKATADFAAQCLDVKIGEEVGYYYRGENMTNKNNVESKLIFTTTGSLISRMTGDDPLLKDYKCIIIDEAHERSIQTDLLLLLLKHAIQKRKDLKVIIMSATINLKTFRDYFPRPIFKFGEIDAGSQLSFPIKDIYIDNRPKSWDLVAINIVTKLLQTTQKGDILIFARSGADADKMCDTLSRLVKQINSKMEVRSRSRGRRKTEKPNTDVANIKFINPYCAKLASGISKEEEELATDETKYLNLVSNDGKQYYRKVVISTNVAESSLTVDGVVYVIDSGLEFQESYNPNIMARSLLEEEISQSSITQRRGRAGRTQPGACFHLYSEKEMKKMQLYPTPDIQKSNLTSYFLDLMRLDYIKNLGDLRHLLSEFISPPVKSFVNDALKTLKTLKCITDTTNDSQITHIGKLVSQFRAIKPQMARSIIASFHYRCSKEVIKIITLLILSDGRIDSLFLPFRPDKKKNKANNDKEKKKYEILKKKFKHPTGDLLSLLNIYNLFEQREMEITKQAFRRKSSMKRNTKSNSKKSISKSRQKSSNKKISKKKSVKEISEKQLLRWCKDNHLNYKKMKKMKKTAMLLKRTMLDIMMPPRFNINKGNKNKSNQSEGSSKVGSKKKSSKKELEKNKNDQLQIDSDDLLEMVELSGGGIKSEDEPFFYEDITELEDKIMMSFVIGHITNIAVKVDSNNYHSCLAQEKVNSKINQNSFLSGENPKYVIFDELFMLSKHAPLKLNMVSIIPDSISKYVSDVIKECQIRCPKQKSMTKKMRPNKKQSPRFKTRRKKHKERYIKRNYKRL